MREGPEAARAEAARGGGTHGGGRDGTMMYNGYGPHRRRWSALLAAGALAAVLALGAAPAPAASKAEAKPGKDRFDKLCAVCHGEAGRGDGQALRGVPVRPRNFADPAAMRGVTDQALFDAIKKGGPAVGKSPLMPSFGDQVKDADIGELVAYIRSLAPPRR
jgi:cytochrome c oxidase cbb3-type subunit III